MGLTVTVVEKAMQYPAICMVRKTHSGPLVDFGMDFEHENTGRMYLSVAVLRAINEKAGFVPREQLATAHERIAELEAQLAETQAALFSADEYKSAVSKTFEGAGFTPDRKQTPKPKPKEAPVGS